MTWVALTRRHSKTSSSSPYVPVLTASSYYFLTRSRFTHQFRTNVAGVAHTTNAFLPLLRAGPTKKVITLSTGLADPDFVRGAKFALNPRYAVSKGALNVLVAEYAAALAGEGFVFLAISPGLVNTAEKPRECLSVLLSPMTGYGVTLTRCTMDITATAEELEGFAKMVALFKTQAPDWDGLPLTPETSVKLMREVIAKAGPQESGAFVSQYGNQKWL